MPAHRCRTFSLPSRPAHSLVDGQIGTIEMPTHDALLALTRWTNIYASARAVIFGDPTGGPVAPAFGTGASDIAVRVAP